MSKKKTSKTSNEFKSYFEEQKRMRKKFLEFVKSIKDFDSLPRAEAWLTFVANHIEEFCEQEALVYLRSRGKSCQNQIEMLTQFWRDAKERERHNIDSTFWGCRDNQEDHINATMLRTVEWCEIGGFEDFWEEVAKSTHQEFLKYGIESKIGATFWLFNMCRSNYAIELMPKSFSRCLESIQLVDPGKKFPWQIDQIERDYDNKRVIVHRIEYLITAATIIFANARLSPSIIDQDFIEDAGKLLLKTQLKDGSWPFYIESDRTNSQTGSVESTAIIIHALMCLKPRGWQNAMRNAQKWLLGQQSDYGHWDEEGGHPDVTYLTVLVLDAFSLINGENNLTFSDTGLRNKVRIISENENLLGDHIFEVALSFPGEYRYIVEEVANKLVEKRGKNTVFYDNFYKYLLGRPNLDTYLQNIYLNRSKLRVIFFSPEYNEKTWCGLEWRAIRSLIAKKEDDSIMFLRLAEGDIDGFFPSIDGYIDINRLDSETVSDLIIKRYESLITKKI